MQFKGVVYVSATGDEIERFFNLCRNRDVTIRHITTSDTECTFEMDAADYLTLKPLLQKTHTKTVLLRKSGLPFLLYRQKKRLVFWVVLLLFVVMLSMTLTRIWKIEIYGNQTISFVQFLDFLEEEKIGYGSAKGKIDDKALQATIRERFPQVIWASVSIEGTCLVIHVKENDTLQFTENEEFPSNIVARTTGTIHSIVVRRGIPLVKKGDVVEPGTLLVSGILEILNDDLTVKSTEYIHADADVLIRYEESVSLFLPGKYEQKEYSGQENRGYFVQFGSWQLQNPLQKLIRKIRHTDHFEQSDTTASVTQLKLIDEYYLPVFWGDKTTREYKIVTHQYTREQAEEILNTKFLQYIVTLEEKGVQIVEKNVNIVYRDGNYELTGTIQCISEAVERKKIEQNEALKQEETFTWTES